MFGFCPAVFSIDDEMNVHGFAVPEEATVRLDPSLRYLINPGSVGQPRDRNPDSAYMILDTERRTVQFFRVEYDLEKTQQAILGAGLPEILAARLAFGT